MQLPSPSSNLLVQRAFLSNGKKGMKKCKKKKKKNIEKVSVFLNGGREEDSMCLVFLRSKGKKKDDSFVFFLSLLQRLGCTNNLVVVAKLR